MLNQKQEQAVQVKIFMGYLLNGEIRMHLNQSPLWKEAKLFQSSSVKEVRYEEKEYIGQFTDMLLPFDQLKQQIAELKHQLQTYCPGLNLDKYSPALFPQLFLY